MMNIVYFPLFALALLSQALYAQHYESNRQEVIKDKETQWKSFNGERYIILESNNYEVLLPDNRVLKGTMIIDLKNTTDESKVFKTDNESLIIVEKDKIFLIFLPQIIWL